MGANPPLRWNKPWPMHLGTPSSPGRNPDRIRSRRQKRLVVREVRRQFFGVPTRQSRHG